METGKHKPFLIKKKYALISFVSGALLILPLILLFSRPIFNVPIFLIALFLSGTALICGVTGLKRKENKTLSLIGSVLGGLAILTLIALTILFLVFPGPTRPAISARVMARVAQMASIAELIYDADASYEKLRCPKENEEMTELDEGMKGLCKDIKLITGVEPTIYASKEEYCIYSVLPRGGYYCRDSSLKMIEVKTNPSNNGYCNGVNFSCPPRD